MELKLRGILSIIENKKLIFSYISRPTKLEYAEDNVIDKTWEKLCKNIISDGSYNLLPYNDKEFRVSLSSYRDKIPDEFYNLISRQVELFVSIRKYSFKNKNNDIITGSKLILNSIYTISDI